MYNGVKSIFKKLIPKRLLFWSEPFLRRRFVYPFYSGKNNVCTVCEAQLKSFVDLPRGDKLCPRCGSLPRDRRLMSLLNDKYLAGVDSILDFSPSRCNHRVLKNTFKTRYVSTDLSGDFIADKQLDIKHIYSDDESFDLIICYHVLEHVLEDQKAMSELYRVLRFGGICLVQTPFKQGDIYEDETVTTEADRLREFGQEDHVRIYSVSGLACRLKKAGFEVNALEFKEEENNKYGFTERETILELKKHQ